jgi:hypothetical protein
MGGVGLRLPFNGDTWFFCRGSRGCGLKRVCLVLLVVRNPSFSASDH